MKTREQIKRQTQLLETIASKDNSSSGGTSGGASEATLQQILAKITNQKDFEESIWYDPGRNRFFIRKITLDNNNNQVIVFTNIDGSATSPMTEPSSIGALVPFKQTDFELQTTDYYANTTNVTKGYTIGDSITLIRIIDTINGGYYNSLCINNTTDSPCAFDNSELEGVDNSMWSYQNEKLKEISDNTLTDGILVDGTLQTVLNTDLLTGTVNGWFDASKFQSATIQIINGTGAGSIIFEQTNNISVTGLPLAVTESTVINANPNIAAIGIAINANRMFRIPVNSKYVRVRVSTAFAGTGCKATAFFSTLPFNSNNINIQQAVASMLQTTATQALGTAATRWFAQISDGTNSPSIKASSVAPLATDPALVVGLSPNMVVSTSTVNSLATTNALLVKATGATVFSITASNIGATTRYLKIYNKATAPVVGTDIPILTIPILTGNIQNINLGTFGLRTLTGLGIAITAGALDNDVAVIGAGEVKVLIAYN